MGAGLAEPGRRGSITIAGGVVEHIARLAANEVDGVAGVGSGLDKVVGRRYPKADADVAGSRVRLNVQIAVAWPYPLADVCARVRETVTTRLSELTGLSIDAVDVTAAKVVQPEQPTRRSVR